MAHRDRDNNGRLLKGHTVSTGGVTREARITRTLMMRATPEAFATILAIMRSKRASLTLKAHCAETILDRGGVQVIKDMLADIPLTKEDESVTWNDEAIDKLLDSDDEPKDE